jgi:outer membrane protein assembly factor BamB
MTRGTSRRGLLIGAGVGSIAVIGGAAGWALSSRSAGGAPLVGTGNTSLPTGLGLPTGKSSSLQRYYGAGTRRTTVWKCPTGNAIQANAGVGGGMVYVASTDNNVYAIDAFGVLYAFHTANGTEIWHKRLLSSNDLPGTGLTIDSGGIFVGTMSGALYKVDAANGKVLWTYHPGSGIESNIAAAAGVVYFRDNNGTLHAISAATNKQLWAKTAVATGIYGQAVAGGRVYYTISLALQALDAKSGDPVWAFTAPNNAALLGTPAVANGLVFIGSYDDGLYAVQA